MSSFTIKTNNHPRELLSWEQLTTSEKRQFSVEDVSDWCGESYFRYRGQIYSLSEFFRTELIKGWDAVCSQTMFSGVVIKFVKGDYNFNVIAGRYAS